MCYNASMDKITKGRLLGYKRMLEKMLWNIRVQRDKYAVPPEEVLANMEKNIVQRLEHYREHRAELRRVKREAVAEYLRDKA